MTSLIIPIIPIISHIDYIPYDPDPNFTETQGVGGAMCSAGCPKIYSGSLPWSPSSSKKSRLMADDHPSFRGKHGKAKSTSGHSGP